MEGGILGAQLLRCPLIVLAQRGQSLADDLVVGLATFRSALNDLVARLSVPASGLLERSQSRSDLLILGPESTGRPRPA